MEYEGAMPLPTPTLVPGVVDGRDDEVARTIEVAGVGGGPVVAAMARAAAPAAAAALKTTEEVLETDADEVPAVPLIGLEAVELDAVAAAAIAAAALAAAAAAFEALFAAA